VPQALPEPQDPVGRTLNRIGHACAWLFAVATVLTVFEVIARYVFGAPTTWTHELTTALCAISFALGGAYSMVRNEHIRISILADRVSPAVQTSLALLGLICGLIYLGALSYAAVLEAADALWRFEEGRWAPEPTPGPPNWPLPALVRSGLAVGALLFLVAVLRQFLRTLRRLD
jgi:C4-dicarboxylate transporter, DctQ subunit